MSYRLCVPSRQSLYPSTITQGQNNGEHRRALLMYHHLHCCWLASIFDPDAEGISWEGPLCGGFTEGGCIDAEFSGSSWLSIISRPSRFCDILRVPAKSLLSAVFGVLSCSLFARFDGSLGLS